MVVFLLGYWIWVKRKEAYQQMVGLFYSSTRVLCIRTIAPPFALAGEEMMVMMYGCKKHVFQVWWCGQELNQRHQDFQSCALPTELPHQIIYLKNAVFQRRAQIYVIIYFLRK